MTFSRLIQDYIEDFADSEERGDFAALEDDWDDLHEHHGRGDRRHASRRRGRSHGRRRGRGRAGERNAGRNFVRLVVLAAIAFTVIRRLKGRRSRGRGQRGGRRSQRRAYA